MFDYGQSYARIKIILPKKIKEKFRIVSYKKNDQSKYSEIY